MRLTTVLLCLLAFCASPTAPTRAEDVTLVTDFGINGRHAYFYVAQERGYYKDAGLNVTIVRGAGSADAVRKVASGAARVGFADAGALVLARGNDGLPVRMLAVVYAAPPEAIYTLEGSGIARPADLPGHRVADSAGSANAVLFGAYAKAVGIDPGSVSWQVADAAALPSLLATGRAEAVGQFVIGEPLLAAAVAPRKLVRFGYREAGLDFYGSGIVASESTIAGEPDMLRRFVAATLHGMRDSFADPKMAGEVLSRAQRQIAPEVAAAETERVEELALTGKSLGIIDPARMAATVDVISSSYALKHPVKPEDMWVPGFVPAP